MRAPLAVWLSALPLLVVVVGSRLGVRTGLAVAMAVLGGIAAVYWAARFAGGGTSAAREPVVVSAARPRTCRLIKVDEHVTSGAPVEVTAGTKVVWLVGPFTTVSFPRGPEGPWSGRVPDGFVTVFTRPGRYMGSVTTAFTDSGPDARCLVVDVRP